MTQVDDTHNAPVVSRRTLVAGTGALAAGALVTTALLHSDAVAQEGELQVPATPLALGPVMPPEYTDYANDWPTQNGNLSNTRASASTTIDSSNVTTLGIAWSYPLNVAGAYGAFTAAPIINGNTIYLVDMQSNLYAIDKTTGETLWTKEYGIGCVGPNGVTVAYGNLYSILGDTAEVVAVDIETQEEVWRVKLTNNIGEGIDIAPIVYDNTVYVSTVPGNGTVFYRGGQKGVFYALDASSGHTIWSWETTTDDLWGNARVNSGGGLWNPPAIDTETGMLYLAVANAAPYPGNTEFPNATSRPGQNDYVNNLVEIDPTTASVQWHVNIKPDDNYDLDNHLSPIIVETEIGGAPVKLVVTSGKHGYVAAVDTNAGNTIWKIPVGTHQNENVEEIPEGGTLEVFPGTLGGVETCMAYADGTVFAAVLNWATTYSPTGIAGGLTLDLSNATSDLVAIDVTNGQIKWQVAVATGLLGAVTIANDVVFTGGLDGVIRAYNAADGTALWSVTGTAGINAPFAISEDYLIVPTTAAYIASPDSNMTGTPGLAIHAFKLGAGSATPDDAEVAPADNAATPTNPGDPQFPTPEATPVA